MKELAIKAYELSREEVQNMEDGQQVLVYNPISRNYMVDYTGKKCIACFKHAERSLIYLSLDDKENIKFKVDDK